MALALAAAGSVTAAAPPPSAAFTASVSVDAGARLATIPDTGVGMNVAVYDENMNHPPIPGLFRDAGVGMVRYPGGSYADGYRRSPEEDGTASPCCGEAAAPRAAGSGGVAARSAGPQVSRVVSTPTRPTADTAT